MRAASERGVNWLAFVQRHRTLARLIPRSWLARWVWADLEATSGFTESMVQGELDMAEGRWYNFDPATGVSTPNPDWPGYGAQPRFDALAQERTRQLLMGETPASRRPKTGYELGLRPTPTGWKFRLGCDGDHGVCIKGCRCGCKHEQGGTDGE